jgi:RHS repeat-associated protein
VRLVIDAAADTVVQRLAYDAYGRVVVDTKPGFQPFGYAGGLYDPLTGLVRFGARDYDAESGRWTGKDPIGFNGGSPNVYEYALGEPVRYTDPDGRAIPVWIAGAVFGIVIDVAGQISANLLDPCEGWYNIDGWQVTRAGVYGAVSAFALLRIGNLAGVRQWLPGLNQNRFLRVGPGTIRGVRNIPRISLGPQYKGLPQWWQYIRHWY